MKMNKQEQEAVLALAEFMKSVGATPEEIEQEFTRAMKVDPTMTPEKIKEVEDLLGFKKKTVVPPKVDLNKVKEKEGLLLALPLSAVLKELKIGRSKMEQDLLDGFLNVIEKKNRELETVIKIKRKLDEAIAEALKLQNLDAGDWIVAALEDLKTDISE